MAALVSDKQPPGQPCPHTLVVHGTRQELPAGWLTTFGCPPTPPPFCMLCAVAVTALQRRCATYTVLEDS